MCGCRGTHRAQHGLHVRQLARQLCKGVVRIDHAGSDRSGVEHGDGGLVITCMAHLGTRTRPVTDHTDRYLTVTDRYIAYLPIPPIPSLPEPVLEFRLSANENVMNFH